MTRTRYWSHLQPDGHYKLLPYPPEPRYNTFGQAPGVSMGKIRPERHAGTGQIIDTVRGWDEADRISGCVTTGHRPPSNESRKAEATEKRKRDVNQAMNRAINDLDWGAAPLSEATNKAAAAEKQQELIRETVGVHVKDLIQ